MKPTRLRHRIELQRNEPPAQGYDRADNWVTYATGDAEKFDPKGDQVVSALQTRSVMTVTFKINYIPAVEPKHRVLSAGRRFDIKAVSDRDGRRRWLYLHCVEHVSDGD